MSPKSKKDYAEEIKLRYKKSSRQEKKLILDEFCMICSYNRKYAIRVLNAKSPPKGIKDKKKRGPRKKYDNPIIMIVLEDLWRALNLPCSKRLKAALPLWLPSYYKIDIPPDIYEKILTISPATIDRLFKPRRKKIKKYGLATTKPGTLLKKHIPVKTEQWNEKRPGFLEADTVAHCGTSTAGMFVYTLNCVDIATTWTEQRATWGKGETGTYHAIVNIENSLPFKLLGFDCDNGSEFLNWHIYRYFNGRKKPIQFTRSRAYKKNDNAHIEEKNWTNIRQYLGYERFEKKIIVDLLNELYTSEWRLYFNFFVPSMKLISKDRIGAKIKKKYDTPKTPFQRILESEYIDNEIKTKLGKIIEGLNPFLLQEQMKKKIVNIMKIVMK